MLERKRRRVNGNNPDKKSDSDSQSDTPISEKSTVKSINKSTLVAQGPADNDDENELGKVWTMEMLMNDGDILTNTMNEEESMSEDEKKFLCARAVDSNHSLNTIPYTSNNGMTKSGHRIQKHDDGRNESNPSRVKPMQILSGDHLADHKYDRSRQFLALQEV